MLNILSNSLRTPSPTHAIAGCRSPTRASCLPIRPSRGLSTFTAAAIKPPAKAPRITRGNDEPSAVSYQLSELVPQVRARLSEANLGEGRSWHEPAKTTWYGVYFMASLNMNFPRYMG